MADAAAALRYVLLEHAPTAALVADRVWHDHAPQDPALPAVTIAQVSGRRPSAMGEDVGLVSGRLQVDVHAATRASAVELGEHVRAALQRFAGDADGVTIGALFVDNEIGPYWADDVRQWRTTIDFRAWWAE